MKVAIIGSRNFEQFNFQKILDNIPGNCTEIVSGGAKGIDTIAADIAEALHLKFTCFKPEYHIYAKSAPLKRNQQIVDYSDYILAVWDIKSKGTMHVLSRCIAQKKPFKVISD